MKSEKALPRSLELWLAHLLGYGTWIGCALIAAGLTIPSAGAAGPRLVLAGIGFFIALPVARVATMLTYFLSVGDKRFGAIAALVLGIICAGVFIGLKF
jgi:uncharacterized membrane protein